MLVGAVSLLLALAWTPTASSAISVKSDLSYIADGTWQHRLDLYLPAHAQGAPVVIFVHGGAFQEGDKNDYASVGRGLAREGLVSVVVSYRLYPDADAQGSISDVARALAWTIAHANDYGIDTRNVFLVGHSTGAQIVTALATNQRFLKDAGVAPSAVRGVLALSGPYDVRDISDESDYWRGFDSHVYGDTVERRAEISATANAAQAAIPIDAACGTREDPYSCKQAATLVDALHAANHAASSFVERGADHMGMVRDLTAPNDPLNSELLRFIQAEGDW